MAWHTPTKEDIWQGAIRIRNCVREMGEEGPFFIGRNGTVEIETLYFWLVQRRGSAAANPMPYPRRLRDQIQRNAGIFPGTDDAIDRWCTAYIESLGYITGTAAGWYQPVWHLENMILDRFAPPTHFRCPLRSLEPYYQPKEFQWTRELKGKKVTVVSSFADTIKQQLVVGGVSRAWRGPELDGLLDASGVTWGFVRTCYAPVTALGHAEWPRGITDWEQAVTLVVKQVLSTEPDIAIVGCGGLGMVIGAALRMRGISVIVLGGATQVLFGIKGQRWATHDVISKFWNEHWVWPAPHEVPGGASMIEGGCYWGPPKLKTV